MKTPTNYGSENEEAQFIRRVVAPDRPNSKRRQKKRLAVAGAALGLLGASAGIGYATLRTDNTSSAVEATQLSADSAFVSELGDAFHPSFHAVDQNDDGIATKDEILADLERTEAVDIDKVRSSNLPDDIKRNLFKLLDKKLRSDIECAKIASDKREFPVTAHDAQMFYYLLDVFCPKITIAVTSMEDADQNGDYDEFSEYNDAQAQEEPRNEEEHKEVVEVVTRDGQTEQVIIEGSVEDGKQHVKIENENGGFTDTEVPAVETSNGEEKLQITDSEGQTTTVTVPNENYMTKQEFLERIRSHFEDRMNSISKQREDLVEQLKSDRNRVVDLQDCIEQASNKFGWYGVYEQAPYLRDALDWVENVCMNKYRRLRG
ncbi:Ankyrin repeat domain-containing protein 60 [Phytophthora boehmeriae]|uniref:Ankyrin repeat domain-containing protein 60 n=1 Tax=Phytophthora boehmeriae TaxID=109152 RepID=A0A8T1WYJ9_9STRA|nr:Ankyrin repeat domain-containing protein 60 [Phytophthora boehmeriae]